MKLIYCPSEKLLVDILTKSHEINKVQNFPRNIGLVLYKENKSVNIEEEC